MGAFIVALSKGDEGALPFVLPFKIIDPVLRILRAGKNKRTKTLAVKNGKGR